MKHTSSYMRYLPLVGALVLLVIGILQLRQRRKPRSFRDDPIGALKDRSEIIADRALERAEEAMERLQTSLEELRHYLPETKRNRWTKHSRTFNKRLVSLGGQAQELIKDLRSNGILHR